MKAIGKKKLQKEHQELRAMLLKAVNNLNYPNDPKYHYWLLDAMCLLNRTYIEE